MQPCALRMAHGRGAYSGQRKTLAGHDLQLRRGHQNPHACTRLLLASAQVQKMSDRFFESDVMLRMNRVRSHRSLLAPTMLQRGTTGKKTLWAYSLRRLMDRTIPAAGDTRQQVRVLDYFNQLHGCRK